MNAIPSSFSSSGSSPSSLIISFAFSMSLSIASEVDKNISRRLSSLFFLFCLLMNNKLEVSNISYMPSKSFLNVSNFLDLHVLILFRNVQGCHPLCQIGKDEPHVWLIQQRFFNLFDEVLIDHFLFKHI